MNFIFFYQQEGKESEWKMALSSDRAKVIAGKPAFTTVLDLSSVPEDRDWSKVRYQGPLYFDFDAGDNLELVCESFKDFLAKISSELNFDISMARLYASGSKGFHVEIPEACFMAKVPTAGTPWLAYVYRFMAESLFVETMDLNVYTGKRGRQWRTTNVKRDNGCYKVPITLEDAMTMTPELYRELIKHPRPEIAVTPASPTPEFVMLFDRAKEKVVQQMRTKKKRIEKANAILDPWKQAKKTPPSIERVMDGLDLAPNAGFQSIAMQLAIYAASVDMPLAEFLDRCKGVIQNHVSDGVRYNTPERRREELARMWEYMSENSLYDFEVGPVVRLLKQGTDTSDLGILDTEDKEDRPAKAAAPDSEVDKEDGDVPALDVHRRLRKGFFMNAEGMFRKSGPDEIDAICRATLRNVDAFYDLEKGTFMGYEFDISVGGKKRRREMAGSDVFTSAQKMRTFFAAHQISFQGGDADVASLMDVMAEKAERGGKTYVYPREGFFIIQHPEDDKPHPVKVFLTKDTFISSIPEDDDAHFKLKYRPTTVTSAYDIDIHCAPDLDPGMRDSLELIFKFNRPTIVADLLGWYIAAHYRSLYLKLFGQFPMLQVYGEAGSGKTQTVKLLAHLHWYLSERIGIKSAMSFTPFALDAHASSSTSAPFLIDEYKPRELRYAKGKLEKIKDLFKASYVGSDVGERGTLTKGAETTLALIKSKATAPIVFMGEAIEMETAIIERSVTVPLSKKFHSEERAKAFLLLQEDPTVLSAIGRQVVQAGFRIDMAKMRDEVKALLREVQARTQADGDDVRRRLAPRMIYNRAIVLHGLSILKRILRNVFGTDYDAEIEALMNARNEEGEDAAIAYSSMSEISKVINRLALMSRDRDLPHEMVMGKDYVVLDGSIEILVEKAYDKYRVYCAGIRDTPLFDTLDAFHHALNSYSPVLERNVRTSVLLDEGNTQRVVKLSTTLLSREGVQSFRD